MPTKIDRGEPTQLSAANSGPGDGTGSKECYDLPSKPTGIVGKIKKMSIDNQSGQNIIVYICDNETDATNITRATFIIAPIEMAIGEQVTLTEKDFGNARIATGVLVGASAVNAEAYVQEVELL